MRKIAPGRCGRSNAGTPSAGHPLVVLAVATVVLAVGCTDHGSTAAQVPAGAVVAKSTAVERAERRLFDGAPPVIGHRDFGIECVECHNRRGTEVAGVGYAPPTPHELTAGIGATARCRQCHVFRQTDELFVRNTFVGLPQDLRPGRRLAALAPPVIPHPVFMRENCAACHTGPAAREEIRTSHPERERCRQCHAERTTTAVFAPEPQ